MSAADRPADLLPTASPKRTRAAVRALVRPRRRLALAAVAALGAAAAVSLLTAPLLGAVIDAVTARDRPWVPLVAGLAVVALGQGLLVVLGGVLVSKLAEAGLADLREGYVERALGLSLERIERAGDGDLTARVADDVTIVGEAARTAIPEFSRSILLIALTGVGLAVLDWRFLVAALVAVPIQVWTAVWYVRRSTPLYREQRLITGELQDQLLDAVGGARTVLAYQMESTQLDAVAERSQRRMDTVLRVVLLHTRFFGRLNAAEWLGLSAVLVVGFVMVRTGAASVGVASAAALYFISLFAPVNQALFVLDTVQSATASLARLVGVVDLPRATVDRSGRGPADGGVRTTGLTHAYRPGHEVLSDIDLEIPDGTRVALVGASGAGKTTLATLVAGVHRPTAGEVRIGGTTHGSGGERSVVLVTQEVHVFSGTIADDLRLADPDAEDGQLYAALDRVGALDWVRALPAASRRPSGAGHGA